MARALDSSQLEGNCGLAIGRASVWPSTCSAQSISWGMRALQLDDGGGQLVDGGEALDRHGRLARREQHLGLEHEAVADDADVLAVAQQLAQAAEEVGAVALQLLHLAGQHDVEAGAEIGDARLAVLVLGLGRVAAPPAARPSAGAAPAAAG